MSNQLDTLFMRFDVQTKKDGNMVFIFNWEMLVVSERIQTHNFSFHYQTNLISLSDKHVERCEKNESRKQSIGVTFHEIFIMFMTFFLV